MHGLEFVQDLAVVMLVAGLVGWACHRVGLSSVVGYLAAGMVVGPFTPPFSLVTNTARIETLAQVGLVFLMFSIGMKLSLRKLRRLGPALIVGTAVGAAVVFIFARALGAALGWPPTQTMFLAAMLMVSSSAISGPSTDGVDIDSSQNVIVRSCYFSVNDDAVCLKGTRHPGLNQEPKSPPVRNVVVENCTFVRGHGALTLGTEAQGISDVEMTDCVVRGKMPMLRLKLRPDTPNQDYRNIRVRNIRLEGTEGQIVHVYGYYGTGVPSPGELVGVQGATRKAPISKVSDIIIENVTGTFGSFGSLSGGTTATVSGVTFRNINVTVTGSAELNTEGVTEVKFENVLVQQAQKL